METIHFKTVDPVSQDLLRLAAKKGIELNWERFEKQQPQDGFLRLGLSCPYGCMQGPCRIDPFGRGADRGICGMNRDTMAAASLLRIALQGVLEAEATTSDDSCCCGEEDSQGPEASEDEDETSCDVDEADIVEAVRMLARPAVSAEIMIIQALRLGLLCVGLAGDAGDPEAGGTRSLQVGYGLLAGDAVRIAVTGQLEESLAEEILAEAKDGKSPELQLLSLGDWIPVADAYLPMACSSGEAELLVSSGKFNLLLAGDGADPGVPALADRMKIPVVHSCSATAAEIVTIAREAFDHRIPSTFAPDAALVEVAAVSRGTEALQAALPAQSNKKVALLGGADSLAHSLGHLPVELAKALDGADCSVVSWGDAAVWMLKQDIPVTIVDNDNGPLAAVLALKEAGKLEQLAGICFSGLRSCHDLSLALGLAAAGMKVAVATPIPVWGSQAVRDLLRQILAEEGGSFTYFDHPATADEILDWFLQS